MNLHNALGDVLCEARSLDRHIRFIDGEDDERCVAFSELYDDAIALLGALQARGMQAGDELVVFTRSNQRFVTAFWAAVLGGIVPVPVAVGISDEHRFKLFRILSQLERPTLYTDGELAARLGDFAADHARDDMTGLLAEKTMLLESVSDAATGVPHVVKDASEPAFIQYSSGSTGDPKGVCLTHRNICSNIRAIVEATGWHGDDQALSWMPLTHDMGLIGYHLSVLAAGMNHAVMDTSLFVRRPLLWLQRASDLKATQLCSPNFGYKHFLRLFERKGLGQDVDLSSVCLILNGAEPISYDLCESFLDAMAPFGLRRETMFPVYGLAEATVGVSIGVPGKLYERVVMHRHSLNIGERYTLAEVDDADAISFVKAGSAIRDVDIRIVDDNDAALDEGFVGHIHVRGASVTEAIYGDPQATSALLTDEGWLRTGDCGVFVDGELVITGRHKDIIIVNGQNYYPHDLEEIIAHVDGLELGKVVVTGAPADDGLTEGVLVFVLYRGELAAFAELAAAVRGQLGESAGLEAEHVLPITRVPKTTSGKVQRAHLLADYLDGKFAETITKLRPAAESAVTDEDPLVAELLETCNTFSKECRINAEDNLFEVGVSSLTLSEIVLAIDEKYPGKLDISDLFDVPTVREIAAFLRSKE